VLILPLFGVNAAAAVADLELLQRLDVPLFLLFDIPVRRFFASSPPASFRLAISFRMKSGSSRSSAPSGIAIALRRPSCRSNHLTSSAGFQSQSQS